MLVPKLVGNNNRFHKNLPWTKNLPSVPQGSLLGPIFWIVLYEICPRQTGARAGRARSGSRWSVRRRRRTRCTHSCTAQVSLRGNSSSLYSTSDSRFEFCSSYCFTVPLVSRIDLSQKWKLMMTSHWRRFASFLELFIFCWFCCIYRCFQLQCFFSLDTMMLFCFSFVVVCRLLHGFWVMHVNMCSANFIKL